MAQTARTILIVEDDASIRRGIVDALAFAGYRALEADTAPKGLEMARTAECDLVLLDLVLPGELPGADAGARKVSERMPPGLEILRLVRAVRATLPVIILTARGDEADRVKGLELGADDYVVKPFSVKELLARVSAVLRRTPQRPNDVAAIHFAQTGVGVDLERREVVSAKGERAALSDREVDLLRYLAQNGGRAVAREELLTGVWKLDPRGVETRTIDMLVSRLREKLGDAEATPTMVVTVRGKGYMLGGGCEVRGR